MDIVSDGVVVEVPSVLELVPVAAAQQLIDARCAELEELERIANDERAQADDLEARAAEEGADEGATTWAMLQLRRFLDRVFDELDQELEAELHVARLQAHRAADTTHIFGDATSERAPILAPPAAHDDRAGASEAIDDDLFTIEEELPEHLDLAMEEAADAEPIDEAGEKPDVTATPDRDFWADHHDPPRRARRGLRLPSSAMLRIGAGALVVAGVAVRLA